MTTTTTTECTCYVTEHYRANGPDCPVHRDPRGWDEISASIRRNLDKLEQMPWAVAADDRRAAKARQTFYVIDGGLS